MFGKKVKHWVRFGCWISTCYGLFSLGTRFETYEPFISLIFQTFWGPRSTAKNWNRGYSSPPVLMKQNSVKLTMRSEVSHEKYKIERTNTVQW